MADKEPIEDSDDSYWFEYGATLRIFGNIPDLEKITATLGLIPIHVHKKGDTKRHSSMTHEFDMWMYTAPVPRDRPLDVHIQTLWSHIKSHKDFLIGLKETLTVDVFCAYQTNSTSSGIEVSHLSLEMFIELKIPFGISMIFA